MSENQENCFRVTRAASKKRTATASATIYRQGNKKRTGMGSAADDRQGNKKRIVLGELPSRNTVLSVSPSETQKLKGKGKVTKARKALVPRIAEPLVDETAVTEEKVGVDANYEDPQMCAPYVTDIYEYLHVLEVDPKRRPLSDYIEKIQKDVTANMRGVLVDWLVEVAEEYKLTSDSLYLTVAYIDRFLSSNTLNRQSLQLLGVSSMHIASKYEEISPPNVEDFCYITDNTYTKEEVVNMESDILRSLNYELGGPTVKTFLRRFTRVAQEDYKNPNLQLEFLGCYLAELSLLDYTCVKYFPSLVASSVIFLTRFIMRPMTHPWTLTLQEYSRYKPAELKECVLIIHDLYLSRRGGTLNAIREKYKEQKFKCVAVMPSPPEIPALFFDDIKV